MRLNVGEMCVRVTFRGAYSMGVNMSRRRVICIVFLQLELRAHLFPVFLVSVKDKCTFVSGL